MNGYPNTSKFVKIEINLSKTFYPPPPPPFNIHNKTGSLK